MKTAILEHRHKHGHDTYVSLVGDLATQADEDSIIQAMIREHSIDYEPPTPEQDEMGDGEELELRLVERREMGVIPIGFPPRIPISAGVWRYSADGEEVTTSRIGVLEGSKRVCLVSTFSKSAQEVEANGRVLAAAPEMMEALEDVQLYFETNGRWVSRRRARDKVDRALRKVNPGADSSVSVS